MLACDHYGVLQGMRKAAYPRANARAYARVCPPHTHAPVPEMHELDCHYIDYLHIQALTFNTFSLNVLMIYHDNMQYCDDFWEKYVKIYGFLHLCPFQIENKAICVSIHLKGLVDANPTIS